MKKIITLILTLSLMSVMLLAQRSEQNNPPQNQPQPVGNHQQHMRSQQNTPNADMPRRERAQRDPMAFWQRLELNRTQYPQVSQLVQTHQQNNQRKMEELRTLKQNARRALVEERYRDARNLNRRITNLQLEMANARVSHHQAIMRILNPEQKQAYQRHMNEMRERMQNRGGDCRMGSGMGMGNGSGYGHGSGHGSGQGDCDDCEDCGKHEGQNHRPMRSQQN